MGVDQIARFGHAVSLLRPLDLTDLYWAGFSCLLTDVDDVPIYRGEFARFFLGVEDGDERVDFDHEQKTRGAGFGTTLDLDQAEDVLGAEREADSSETGGNEVGKHASLTELLRRRSLADWTEEELHQLPRLLRLDLRFPTKLQRRHKPGAAGSRIDLRRTVRRSFRREGEMLERVWRRRVRRRRPVLILIDVSGSMSAHSRSLLHFAYLLTMSGLTVETFGFGTRLTRLTRHLSDRDPDRAVSSASTAVEDWSGGTRIGESLGALLKGYGSRAGVRGAVVLLFSDGLERGEPELLADHMSRLRRLAHAVIWLNPLKGDDSYLPLARGMQAALPYVDLLVAADSVEDLTRLSRRLATLV